MSFKVRPFYFIAQKSWEIIIKSLFWNNDLNYYEEFRHWKNDFTVPDKNLCPLLSHLHRSCCHWLHWFHRHAGTVCSQPQASQLPAGSSVNFLSSFNSILNLSWCVSSILRVGSPPEKFERCRCNFPHSGAFTMFLGKRGSHSFIVFPWSRHGLQLLTTIMFW